MGNILGKSRLKFAFALVFVGISFFSKVTSTIALDNTLSRLERNDPTLTSVRFWNFGEPSNSATLRLFNALSHNTHLQSIEVSMEAGMGRDADIGVRLSNACLKRYSTDVKSNTGIEKWIINDKCVKALADALRANTSLTSIHFSNALFAPKHLVDLGTAIRGKNTLRKVTLGVALNSTVALEVVRNPNLVFLNLDDNVDLTLPDRDIGPFFQGVHDHPNLHTLSLKSCGELYIHLTDLFYLSRLAQEPGYHLKAFSTNVDIEDKVRQRGTLMAPLANYTLPAQVLAEVAEEAAEDGPREPRTKKNRVSLEDEAPAYLEDY
jgi:hypothetical protein